MKAKYILVASVMASMAATSCSDDFLEVSSATQVFLDEYYTTEERAFEAVVAAYDPLTWPDLYGQYCQWNFIAEAMADDFYPAGASDEDGREYKKVFNYDSDPLKNFDGLWTVCYSGVNRSNNAIKVCKALSATETDEAVKTRYNQYINEAKFLRCFYYSMLWKYWGNVPYYTEALEFPYICKQSTPLEIGDDLVKQLKEVIDEGGFPMKYEEAKWYGRISKAAAIMLYTDVAMYNTESANFATNKETAKNYLLEIYNSGKYALSSDLDNLYKEGGEWCSESILEYNYNSENAARGWGDISNDGGTVTPRYISPAFSGSPDYNDGWAAFVARKEAFDQYADNDKRKDAFMIDMDAYCEKAGCSWSRRYESPIQTGYFTKKYIARVEGNVGATGDATCNYDDNFRVYRYAETLLWLAELTGDAKYINEVQDRAGVDKTDASIDNVLSERRKELVFEGKRYFDLVRTGKAAEVLTAANDPAGARTNNWDVKHKYIALPASELANDPSLVQNEAYR